MEIPGYKLIDTLGEGSIAIVYLAVENLTEKEVALKLVTPEVCADPTFVDSFLHRARLLGELEHPHVVKVFSAGLEAGSCYLAMARIAGRTLRHRRFELSLLEQLAVVKDVAEALDYAHGRGCKHGRLTPDNIMLRDRDHRVLVTDFVMGKAPVTGTEQRRYQSPERQRGLEGDLRSDIYSLGAILMLLLGAQPLQEEAQAETQSSSDAQANKAGLTFSLARWFLPEGLSVFRTLVDRALALRPEDRYQSGAELIAALNEVTETQLEQASGAQALAWLSNGKVDRHPKAAADSLTERKPAKSAPPQDTSSPSVTVERQAPAEPDLSKNPADMAVSCESEQGPGEGGSAFPEADPQAGVLRVWEADRIDNPFQSEPPSRWLIVSYGLAALILVSGVLLAAMLD